MRKACRAVGFSYHRLVYPQLAAGERSVSTQQAVDLVALADVARHDPAASAYLPPTTARFTDFRDRSRRHARSSSASIGSSISTDIAATTSRTGRCRGCTSIRRRRCLRSALS